MRLNQITRRSFLKSVGLSALAATTKWQKTYVITHSFDDGFRKSSIETARIFEKHGLSACINVIATAHHDDFVPPNDYHLVPAGDFGLWNELVVRGHEVMPHGYKHQNLTEVPLQVAKDLIMRCLDYFSGALDVFEPGQAIFNFPYNASNGTYIGGYAKASTYPFDGSTECLTATLLPTLFSASVPEGT